MLVPLAVAALAVAVCRHRHAVLLLGLLLSSMAYELWVGGDAWESFLMTSRYISVVLPAAVALFFIAIGHVLDPAHPVREVARSKAVWCS